MDGEIQTGENKEKKESTLKRQVKKHEVEKA